MNQLVERQKWLQSAARSLLRETDLFATLETAGHVQPVGSFNLGLMVWPDLDIEVITTDPPQPETVLDVLRDLVLTSGIQKINYADHRTSTGDGPPAGIYVGPDVGFRGLAWQVDLWFIDRTIAQQRRNFNDHIRRSLDGVTRKAILEIKQVAAASDTYHRDVSSVDIYQAVLDHNVRTVDGFVAYLATSGREL